MFTGLSRRGGEAGSLRTFVALGVMAAIPVIIAIVLKINPPSSPESGGGPGGRILFLLRFAEQRYSSRSPRCDS